VLLKFGGILLRNFNVSSMSEFNRTALSICPNLLDYTYRSTPRKKLGGKIYTATEYPADRIIPLHNECSYTTSWPSKIFFFCAIPPQQGGQTPLADSRKVLEALSPDIVQTFEKKQVLYKRTYTQGVDLPWEEVFQTDKKDCVGAFCEKNNIQYEWSNTPLKLTTKQVAQAVAVHPKTQEKIWFNQAHLFHQSSLEKQSRELLLQYVGEDNFPRNSFYGDGSPISNEIIKYIHEAYKKESIIFDWKIGDILILDNHLMAHGRYPYEGERKIAVAMG